MKYEDLKDNKRVKFQDGTYTILGPPRGLGAFMLAPETCMAWDGGLSWKFWENIAIPRVYQDGQIIHLGHQIGDIKDLKEA